MNPKNVKWNLLTTEDGKEDYKQNNLSCSCFLSKFLPNPRTPLLNVA